MKCIKELCKYYKSHDYRMSYFVCSVGTFTGHHKDGEYDCTIDEEIDELTRALKDVMYHRKRIESKQKT